MLVEIQSSEDYIAENSKGTNKYWKIHILESIAQYNEPHLHLNEEYFLQQEYWSLKKDGTESIRQRSEPKLIKGKNIGKSNETSPLQQARLEFLSIIEKQKDKGYHLVGKEAKVEFLPMLAQTYKDTKFAKLWPTVAYSQPKVDGIRCIISTKGAFTRKGKPFIPEVVAHIIAEIENLPDDVYLDGELILPMEGGYSFQETMTAIKKFDPERSPLLQYIIYDYYDVDYPNLTFEERFNTLALMKEDEGVSVKLLETNAITHIDQIKKHFDEAIAAGYEGLMIRLNTPYAVNQRSSGLLKYKEFEDSEYEIVNIVQGEGSYVRAAIFVCKLPDSDITFNVNFKCSMQEKQRMFINQQDYIGQQLTVKYQGLSEDNVPRFPVGLAIRSEIQG